MPKRSKSEPGRRRKTGSKKIPVKSPYVIAAVTLAALVLGLGIGYVMRGAAEPPATGRTEVKAIVLLDDRCSVCNKDLNAALSYLRENLKFGSIPQEEVYVNSKKGMEVYRKLLEENINTVPAVVFEGNVFSTEFYRALEEKLGDASRYIKRAGDYYVLLPGWTTRVHDPERPGKRIVAYFDGSVQRDNVERFMYRIVPDADLELREANGGYLLRFEAPAEVMAILKQVFPVSEVEGNALTVPYVEVNVSAQGGFLEPVAQSVGQIAPNVRIASTEVLDENSPYLAVIKTDRPELLKEALKGWERRGRSFIAMRSERPRVELFVMSYCPYGLQAEKAIIPVLRLLGDEIDFKLRFVNYAMHGEKEVWENLRQHCIQLEEDLNTLIGYLHCFTERGDAESCMKEVGIDVNSVRRCMDREAERYGIPELLKNPEAWNGPYPPYPPDDALNRQYGVRGSPTLVIEGIRLPTPRNPEDLKKVICRAFLHPPEECSTELPSKKASPGFGGNYNGSAATGQCG